MEKLFQQTLISTDEMTGIQALERLFPNKRISEITGLQRDVETVGNCLTGVLEAFQEISQDNGPAARIILGRVEKDCEKSGEILEEIENLETSLDEVTQDSLELIRVC